MSDVDFCARELVYLGDEIRETSSLIQLGDYVASWKHGGLATRFGLFGASGRRTRGGQGIQYLGENLDRARGHWHRALGHCDALRAAGNEVPLVVELLGQLDEAGIGAVLPALQQDAVPGKAELAAVHLGEVSRVLSACSAHVTRTSTRLSLDRRRDR